MPIRSSLVAVGAIVLASSAVGIASPADAATGTWRNCTAVHKTYAHGVGRSSAHDKTSGKPVTSFRHSNALYKTAMDHNRGLDRDKDNIACEAA